MKGMSIKIKRWGNGNGILLPKVVLDMLSLKADDFLSIEMQDEKIILSPIKKRSLTLAERFSNYTGETEQQEFWLDDDPVGKEFI